MTTKRTTRNPGFDENSRRKAELVNAPAIDKADLERHTAASLEWVDKPTPKRTPTASR
jgi:hypothetical protein